MKILCQLQCTNKEKKVYSYNEISETEIISSKKLFSNYFRYYVQKESQHEN